MVKTNVSSVVCCFGWVFQAMAVSTSCEPVSVVKQRQFCQRGCWTPRQRRGCPAEYGWHWHCPGPRGQRRGQCQWSASGCWLGERWQRGVCGFAFRVQQAAVRELAQGTQYLWTCCRRLRQQLLCLDTPIVDYTVLLQLLFAGKGLIEWLQK